MRKLIIGFVIGWLTGTMMAKACGIDSDCEVGERAYRIAMPEDKVPTGALIYSHGYKGSAAAAMRNKALIAFAHEQGLALVATKSASDDWLIPGVPEDPNADGQVELEYYDAVIVDLADRHGIDTDRLVATGFSAGGMMVWTLACHRGDAFAAFIPVAGTFWEPVPEICPSYPVSLVHIHGTEDKIVPIEGRSIKTTRQGHVLVAIDRLVETADYEDRVREISANGLSCKAGRAPGGQVVALCTHPGGHSLKMDHLRTGMDILRTEGVF